MDSNNNGIFDPYDTVLTGFNIISVPRQVYTTEDYFISGALKLGELAQLRLASSILRIYIGDASNAVIKPDANPGTRVLETKMPELSIIAGANFDPVDSNYDNCQTTLQEYVFSGTEVSDIIVGTNTVAKWYDSALRDLYNIGTLKEGSSSLVNKNLGGDFGNLDALSDAHLAIGGHSIESMNAEAQIVKDVDTGKLCAESIHVYGVLTDLYDYNYFDTGKAANLAIPASVLQLGWNSGLNDTNMEKGKLFFTKFKFDKTKDLYEYRFDMFGNKYKQYFYCY